MGFLYTIVCICQGKNTYTALASILYCLGAARKGSSGSQDIIYQQYMLALELLGVGKRENPFYVLPALIAVLMCLCLVGSSAGNGSFDDRKTSGAREPLRNGVALVVAALAVLGLYC